MMSTSRASLALVADRVAERRTDPAFGSLAGDLYAACSVLGSQKALREALSDAGRPARTRAEIASSLFDGKISPLALEVLSATVHERWSDSDDLVAALRILGDQAAFIAASDSGSLETTEDQIFRIGRAVAESPALQSALTDPAISASTKAGIVTDLLADRVTETTMQVVVFTLSHLDGRRIEEAIDELVHLAAAQRERMVAIVRVARPLDADLAERMTAALRNLTGRTVTLNVVVDPSVLGGAHVTVGGEVIDGTVATRLADAARTIAG